MVKYKKTAINMIEKYKELQCKQSENPDRTSYPHMRWMLEEVINSNYSSTKMNRWLGYVQGVLSFKKMEDPLILADINHCYNKKNDDIVTSHLNVVRGYLQQDIDHPEKSVTKNILKLIDLNLMNSDDANRLLGIVQGIYVCNGIIDVEEERDRTRKLFNGE